MVMTRKQLVEAAINDPAARAASGAIPLVAERRRLYAKAAAGLLADLAAAGYPSLSRVGELQGRGDYATAVPVLLAWLPRVRYLLLADDIVRMLAVPFAREEAFPVLLEMFRDPPPLEDPLRPATSEPPRQHFRATVGDALSVFAGPSTGDDLIELVQVEEYGEARALIIRALPKTKDPRVPEVSMGLLDQPTVVAFAIEALGKLRFGGAREQIARMVDSADENVRDQARKALKRLDSAAV